MSQSDKDKMKKLIRFFDRYSPFPFFYPFEMTEKEKRLFEQVVSEAKVYVEFGMGGSTIHVVKNSNSHIYALDSSKEWVDLIKSYLIVRLNKNRIHLLNVNIGPTKEWVYPVDDNNKELFPNYSADIFNSVDPSKIDTVFVDGRFRVACALQSILQCHDNANFRIMVHDFWNREKYHIVLKYLKRIDQEDKMGVFKVASDIDLQEIKNLYETYKYIPD